MPGKVFINYRRGDEPGYTQALFQRLEAEFDRAQLFMDVEGYIKPGDNFVRVLEEKVAECDVLLAVIGPRWIDIRDETEQRRLESEEDFVRIEIVSAITQGKRIIPVLVNNARMPGKKELPKPLESLADFHAIRLSHDRFLADCQGLATNLRAAFAAAETARGAAGQVTGGTLREGDTGGISGGTSPTGPAEARRPSYLLLGLVFFSLAGLFGWVGWTLAGDRDVARLVIALIAAVSLFFCVVGTAALRAHMNESGRKRLVQDQESRGGLSG